MNEQILDKFKQLTDHECNTTIHGILNENIENNWTLPLGDSPLSILMNLYRLINSNNKSLVNKFLNSCFYNLKTIPKIESNSKEIYCLIYIIHEIKPIEYKEYIFSLIISNELTSLKYGNSELEFLLVKSFILLEDKNNFALKEWFQNKKLDSNYIYLRPLFYSHIQDFEQVFKELKSIFTGNKSLNEKESFIFYNTLVDIFPSKIQLSTLIYFLHTNKISITKYPNLTIALEKSILKWKKNRLNYDILILHLEDYFNQNENNLNSFLMEELYNYDKKLSSLIAEYFLDGKYNQPIFNTENELINHLFEVA